MALSQRFVRAVELASRLHSAQLRKGTDVPYLAHLLSVAAIVLEHGGGEDEAIAALLHDAVEDQGGAPVAAEIARQFGAQVASIVAGCTDADTVPKPPWRERKERYVSQLAEAPPEVRLVAAADKLHNAQSIVDDLRIHGDSLWARFTAGKSGTLWYYRAVVTSLQRAGGSPLVEKLDRVVSELERAAAAGSGD